MFQRFRAGEPLPSGKYGRERDYNVDLIPKFMMTAGELVTCLVHTNVTRYMDFQQISGSFVWLKGKGLYKVPATEAEALSSGLLGFMDKTKAVRFLHYVKTADPDDPNTWDGWDLRKMSMAQVYSEYGLGSGPQDMIGHALALHHDESYMDKPAIDTFRRIRLYMLSLARFGKSSYIYPLYGLGELPQGFARLSAIYGGTYMLNTQISEIMYDTRGHVCGVKGMNGEAVSCKAIVADPTYSLERVRKMERVIRVICLLSSPIPNTDQSDSLQVILPRRQLDRTNDIYVACVSSAHHVCAKGYYVAIVSTIIETDDPHTEIQPALNLLGPIVEKFVCIGNIYEPVDDGRCDGLFITRTLDASSHFETVFDDVRSVYERLTGQPLVIKKRVNADEEQATSERNRSTTNV